MFQGDTVKNFDKYVLLFIIGGIGYGLIEIAFRGFTHWSMIITGGSAFISIYLINKAFPNTSILSKSVMGCLLITLLEFTVGLIVNKVYTFGVWDYTGIPGNILGIVSINFSLCWFGISFAILLFFRLFDKLMNLQKS